MAIRRIGQILVDLGYISDDQLELLLEEQQQQPGELLGKVAQEMGLVSDEQVVQALAEQLSMQVFTIGDTVIEPQVLEHINETMAEMYRVVPIRYDEDLQRLTVVTCDPQKLAIQDELRTLLGFDIEYCKFVAAFPKCNFVSH